MRFRPSALLVLAFAMLVYANSSSLAFGQTYTVDGANALAAAKNGQGLVNYATAWTKAQPNNVDAWAELGNAYALLLNRPKDAIAPLQRCVALAPNLAPAWHALGATYVMAGRFADGVNAIKKAIAINPNQPTYYNNLAAAYSGGGAFATALATLDKEKPLAARLNNVNVWYYLGNGYTKLGDSKSAVDAYKRMLQLKPNFAEGWTNLGAALQFSGDNAGAKAAYKKGQALGDPLASKDEGMLEAAERAAQQPVTISGRINSNVSHSYDYYHDVSAGVDPTRTY